MEHRSKNNERWPKTSNVTVVGNSLTETHFRLKGEYNYEITQITTCSKSNCP